MPRDTPAPLTAMQKVQLASARQKLKLDTAKARQVEEVVSASDIKLNQFGRPIVGYEDMPELEEADAALFHIEFERLACPHAAVAKYRPGYGPKSQTRKHAKDCWYFYETGVELLFALCTAGAADGPAPEVLDLISTDKFKARDAMEGLVRFLMLEHAAKKDAAPLRGTTVEKLKVKSDIELAEIRESLDRRFEAKGTRTWEHI